MGISEQSKMKIKLIIQARMDSSRFPGKSFHMLNGKPALSLLIDSLCLLLNKNAIIIATSSNLSNDVIREYGLKENIQVFSGDENNVADRFYKVLKRINCDYFVRLNGDSPLFCAQELAKYIEFKKLELSKDIYTTTVNRTYPKGSNFEIVKTSVFTEHYRLFNDPDHFEHVTKYFYDNKEHFSIEPIAFKHGDYSKINLCFDTKVDFVVLKSIYSKMSKPHFKYSLIDKCKLYIQVLKLQDEAN
jgi:spore coat polysaccharide biosynthesis protein SpsF (cytidylyltransferase family)